MRAGGEGGKPRPGKERWGLGWTTARSRSSLPRSPRPAPGQSSASKSFSGAGGVRCTSRGSLGPAGAGPAHARAHTEDTAACAPAGPRGTEVTGPGAARRAVGAAPRAAGVTANKGHGGAGPLSRALIGGRKPRPGGDWPRPQRGPRARPAPRGRNLSPKRGPRTRPGPRHLPPGRGAGRSRVPAQPPAPLAWPGDWCTEPPTTAAVAPGPRRKGPGGQGSRAREGQAAQMEGGSGPGSGPSSWPDRERGQGAGGTREDRLGRAERRGSSLTCPPGRRWC